MKKCTIKKVNGIDCVVPSEKAVISPGQSIMFKVDGTSPIDEMSRFIASSSDELIADGLFLLNSGQVLDSKNLVGSVFVVTNVAPSVISLQSKERGGFPDLSIWNEAGVVSIDEDFVICKLNRI